MKQFFHKYFMYIAVLAAALLIVLDQWTKALAVSHLKQKPAFVLLDGVLELHYFENTGAAWGMLKNKQTLFYVLTLLFFVIVVYEIKRLYQNHRFIPLIYTLMLMFAGAAGNFIDRLCNKYVVDFIYVRLIDFPIFNLADCYITISVVLMMLLLFFYYTDEEYDMILPFFSDSDKQKKED